MYIVQFKGTFGFIKPSLAVNHGYIKSQNFLSQSTIEGIEKKIFPNFINDIGIQKIIRYKLQYQGYSEQTEVSRSLYRVSIPNIPNAKGYQTNIIKRDVLMHPVLTLAFTEREYALLATYQHFSLSRNEDIMYPIPFSNDTFVKEITEDDFNLLKGVELIFDESHYNSINVGFNRYTKKEDKGYIHVNR